MAAPYILAKSLREAHVFAREQLGLERGRYRVVNTASTVSSMRGSDLYLVPGYENRFDRFAMRGALRYTRLNVIDVAAKAKEPDFVVVAVPDDTEPPAYHTDIVAKLLPDGLKPEGVQLTLISNEEANAFFDPNNILPLDVDAPLDELGPTQPDDAFDANPPAEEPEKPAKRVRRRRCKECGELVLPDEVDAHAAEHLPTEE